MPNAHPLISITVVLHQNNVSHFMCALESFSNASSLFWIHLKKVKDFNGIQKKLKAFESSSMRKTQTDLTQQDSHDDHCVWPIKNISLNP